MYIPVGGAVRVTKLTPLDNVRFCKTPEVMLVFPRCLSIYIVNHTLFICKVGERPFKCRYVV